MPTQTAKKLLYRACKKITFNALVGFSRCFIAQFHRRHIFLYFNSSRFVQELTSKQNEHVTSLALLYKLSIGCVLVILIKLSRKVELTCIGGPPLIMLVRQNVVLSIFFGVVVLLKSSQQRKPEDQCIKGKEYLSTTLFGDKHGAGTCVSCPRHWTVCDQQPTGDKERCEKSCRGMLLI